MLTFPSPTKYNPSVGITQSIRRHYSLHETVVQTSLTQLSPQPITQLLLLHPDYITFYSNHCHNGQGHPPVGHRAKCLMSGGWGLPKPRHTHATTPVFRKHQFNSAKLHVSMFRDDIASCHDVPMTLTGVFTTLLDIPIATPAGEIQFWASESIAPINARTISVQSLEFTCIIS